MLLAAFLLSMQGGTVDAPAFSEERRTDIVPYFRRALEATDRDHDGRLSRIEWAAEVDKTFPEQARPGEATDNYAEVRTQMAGFHRRWDTDGDGWVTLDEIVREPLASFDCMDSDGNQRLTQAEIWSGMGRCAVTD